jgi:hypothetical protein
VFSAQAFLRSSDPHCRDPDIIEPPE